MKKTLSLFVIMVMAVAALPGCAKNDITQNDITHPKTENESAISGAAIGAMAGVAVGVLAGGAAGGMVVGARLGALAGTAQARAHVAEQKADYASTEKWLDACIAQAKDSNKQLEDYNAALAIDIGTIDRRTVWLERNYTADETDEDELLAWQDDLGEKMKNSIEEMLAKNGEVIAAAGHEIKEQNKALAEAGKDGKRESVDALRREIRSLERQRAQLKKSDIRLRDLSRRLSV